MHIDNIHSSRLVVRLTPFAAASCSVSFGQVQFSVNEVQKLLLEDFVAYGTFFLRFKQYLSLRPTSSDISKIGRSRARWRFARDALSSDLHASSVVCFLSL